MANSEADFEAQVRRMHRISTGDEQYGAGNEYEQATNFYLDHLVDECADRARAHTPGLPSNVALLISMAGYSPRITVLAYKILRPRRLVVIPSDDTVRSVDVIRRYVFPDKAPSVMAFAHHTCESTDPLTIYDVVKQELAIHTRMGDSTGGDTFIDITGGRKVMAASAALAAWQLDLRLCYVDGDYDGRLKQAIPGSDRLLMLENPISLFGEQAMDVARQAFASGAFEAARNRFEELAGRLSRPAQARFMAALSALYRAWCDLDLTALPTTIAEVRRTLEPVQRKLRYNTVRSLYAQLDYLDELAAGDEDALLLCFGLLAEHYRRLGRHDFAALYSYRLIEGCTRIRLASLSPGFACKPFDFGASRAELQERYRATIDAVREVNSKASLPRESGVFSNAALLYVLEDELAVLGGLDSVERLRELRELAEARNQSVLAHGSRPVDTDVSAKLHEVALGLLRAYWSLHRPDEDIDVGRAHLAFVMPDDAE